MYCISYVFSNHFYLFVFIALIAYVGHPWRCNVAKHSFWMQQCVSLHASVHVSCMSPHITPSAKLFLQSHCHIVGLWTAICLTKSLHLPSPSFHDVHVSYIFIMFLRSILRSGRRDFVSLCWAYSVFNFAGN